MKTLQTYDTLGGGKVAFYLEDVQAVELKPAKVAAWPDIALPERVKVTLRHRSGECKQILVIVPGGNAEPTAESVYWILVRDLRNLKAED